MSTPIHGDSSAATWHAQTLSNIEAYADAQADAAAEAYWNNQNNQNTQGTSGAGSNHSTDGVDLPTSNQRALDAFLGPDAARGGTAIGPPPSNSGTSGRTYLEPADAELHREQGFTVLTDEQGRAYLPPQGGFEVIIEPVPWTVLAGLGHTGSTTGAPSVAPAQSGTTPSGPSSTPGEVDAITEAGKTAEPDAIRSTFGEKIDALLNASPTLRAKWEQAVADGWKIKHASGNTKSNADAESKTVWINPADIRDKKNFDIHMAALLAHELGHAVTPHPGRFESKDRDAFVAVNTEIAMQYEGAAAFENARARDEIKRATGTDIGIRGGYDEVYKAIYEQYKAGAITEAQAKAQMANAMAAEIDRVNPDGSVSSKEQVAEQKFGDDWDEEQKKKPAQ